MSATAKKVLIVDDEPLVRRSLQKTLQRAGFVVDVAGDCNGGLSTFDAATNAGAPYDLAVLDINMPDFTDTPANGAGLQLLGELTKRNNALPVVMLTAYDEVNKAKEAMTLGAKNYFVKGREQGLVDLVQSLLDA